MIVSKRFLEIATARDDEVLRGVPGGGPPRGGVLLGWLLSGGTMQGWVLTVGRTGGVDRWFGYGGVGVRKQMDRTNTRRIPGQNI